MAGNFTFTSTGRFVLDQALMRSGTVDTSFLGIGSQTTSADDYAARIMLEAERDILLKNPILARASSTVTVSAGTDSVSLPASASGLQVHQVSLVQPDGRLDGLTVLTASPASGLERRVMLGDDFEMQSPRYVYWDVARSALTLEASVTEDTDFVVTYQAGPTAYSSSTFGSDTSKVPDQHIDALYLKVASEFASIMGKPITQELDARAERAAESLHMALMGPFWKYPRFRNAGSPGSTIDHVQQSTGRYLIRPNSTVRY